MIRNQAINAIRALGIDAINKANSGHPGIVLGAAPMAYTLWTNHLTVNPEQPNWFNRDRFVLSAGHGSALLYSLLHLSGFNLTIEDLKNFRQTDSKTPGHPEYGHTEGVDATTGPLGQGVAMGVGMALAERYLANKFNRDQFEVFNHYTYVLCGDGDLMEGVANEAVSLAGHLGLGKLILLYDSNDISLDGATNTSFSENILEKFKALGWHTVYVKDGNDVDAINEAINEAKQVLDQPSIIEIKTIIGYGAPNQGTHKVHGSPIGEAGAKHFRETLGWAHEPFQIPEEIYQHFNETVKARGIAAYEQFTNELQAYEAKYPELYQELMDALTNRITVDLKTVLPQYELGHQEATRNYSYECLNAVKEAVPSLVGGSADLSSSTKALFKNEPALTKTQNGRHVMFGVREFAMAAIANGMALHQGIRPFVSTFFVFSDYLKPAMRLSALMNLPVLYILTHDSIAVGEDGPTHEPIEQLAMLRSIPNVLVFRPADGNETASAYQVALETTNKPSVLVLTRQNVTTVSTPDNGLAKGAYIVSEAKGEMDGIIIATGSEVSLAVLAQQELEKESIYVRVVSMPSMELFKSQPKTYQESILPRTVRKRLSLEMASTYGWHQFVGLDGITMGIDTFGASGKVSEVLAKFRFTVKDVVETYKSIK